MAKAKSNKSVKSTLQLKKPKDFEHGNYQLASVSRGFDCQDLKKRLPDVIYIHCEELSIKRARKLARWLNSACDYLSQKHTRICDKNGEEKADKNTVNTSNRRGKT